jgi:hypothetical protein
MEMAMAVSGDFYQTQADLCATAAAAADLPMLREKYESAGAAWQALAQRETDIAEARTKRIAAEAARKADADVLLVEAGHGSQ